LPAYLEVKAVCALFFGCLLATTVLTPLVMRFARRVDAVDRGGYRKVFEGAMPLLGGLAIAAPIILLGLAAAISGYVIIGHWKWIYLHHKEFFSPLLSVAGRRNDCMTLAIGGIAIVALGLLDDTKGLRARWKLLGQIGIALFVCLSGHALSTLAVPFIGVVRLDMSMGGLLTMLWVVGLINAFNLIDGIDGLATGTAFVATVALIALSIIQENVYVTFAAAALAGSLLAFLRYNFPPARIFLGDTGSMFLGYALAMMSLMGSQKSEAAMITSAPMLALGFPIFETLISMLRRYLRGVPIFAGDNLHTHHRLLSKGYSQPQVVLILCGTGFSLAAAAIIAALVPENSKWAWCSYAFYLATLVIIAWVAGYLERTTFKTILKRRQRNEIFQALGQYVALRLNADRRPVDRNLLLLLCRQELGLRRLEVRMKDGDRLMLSADGMECDTPEPSKEKLRVKSLGGQDILIGYEFEHTPTDSVRQDVSQCLAAIFDQMAIEQEVEPGEEVSGDLG